MTKSGEVKWRASRDTTPSRDKIHGKIYETKYETYRLIIYEYSYKSYNEDFDEYYTSHDVALEFVDDEGRVEWSWPETESRRELLEVVRYRSSRARGFLEKLNDASPKSHEDEKK